MLTPDLDTLTRLARVDLDARSELARLMRQQGDPRGNMVEQACTAPSAAKWTRLLELADAQPVDDHRHLVTWLTQFVTHWPERLRVPLSAWLRPLAAGQPHTLARLCRTLVTERATTPPVLRGLLDHRALRALTTLEIGFNALDGQAARLIVMSPLRNLHTLTLNWCDLGADEIRTLASWDGARRLVTLDLSDNRIDDEAALTLARSLNLAALQQLNVANNPIGPAGQAALQAWQAALPGRNLIT